MRPIFSLLIICFLASCASKKQSVVFHSQLHHSHCGGVPPTEETIKGYDAPNNMDIIIAGKKDSMVLEINGSLEMKLKSGTYRWYQENKSVETNELLERLESDLDTNYVIEGAECINQWKAKEDGVFTINEKSDTIYLTLQYKCYTGILPCVKYVGPRYP